MNARAGVSLNPRGIEAFASICPGLRALALAAILLSLGCGVGESGIAPPSDRVFLPSTVVVDPQGDWLYVVNSNSDLRYNAGTVSMVDLRKAAADRGKTSWGHCPAIRFVPSGAFNGNFCCHEFNDRSVLDCDDRGYVDPRATVRIGSFGGTAVLQCRDGTTCTKEDKRRLLVAVRSDPSISFVDVQVNGDTPRLRCSDAPSASTASGFDRTCDRSYRVDRVRESGQERQLDQEPFALTMDSKLGVLYVGHNHPLGGITTLDVCDPDHHKPAAASVLLGVFDQGFQSVTGVGLLDPGRIDAPLFATGPSLSRPAQASQLKPLWLKGAEMSDAGCVRPKGGAARGLELVPGMGFYSGAFYPTGTDIRAVLRSKDEKRLFVLHRNAGSGDPSALVALEIPQRGKASAQRNAPTEVLEMCAGPSSMQWHNTGRGDQIYVLCFEAGQIYVVDPNAFAVSAIINLGRGPSVLAFTPHDPTIAYVAEFVDNDIAVLDLTPGSRTENRIVQRIGFPRASGK